jgi:hypothetical protein
VFSYSYNTLDYIFCLVFFFLSEISSKYYGVSWYKPQDKWAAHMWHKGKKYICYCVEELEAARAVNRLCVRLGIPIKNPDADINSARTAPQINMKVTPSQKQIPV